MTNKTKCPCCKRIKLVSTHRRLTQYTDDRLNYLLCCKSCIGVDNSFYNDMWKDYYKSQGVGEF